MVSFQDWEQAAVGSHSGISAEICFMQHLHQWFENRTQKGNSKFANDIELFWAVKCWANDEELQRDLIKLKVCPIFFKILPSSPRQTAISGNSQTAVTNIISSPSTVKVGSRICGFL